MRFGGVLRRVMRNYLPVIRRRGALLRQFTKKLGFVYFGSVDQHSDEHEMIRGLTVSTTHQDSHYAVGAYDGYDISMVDRFDLIEQADGSFASHSWLIMRFNLQNTSIPHFFLHPVGHGTGLDGPYQKYFTAFHYATKSNQLLHDTHSVEFHGRYDLYTSASHVPSVESSLSPDVSQTIAARFWPHAIEVIDGALYVYITEHRLTEAMLGATVQAGIWLATALDNESN
ncbi:hypothetical protein H7200_02815 [Candidatus Saccharibacteria bacterium]|nr:hypothetical protein [Candidatus Saccharibacteria bacterium]